MLKNFKNNIKVLKFNIIGIKKREASKREPPSQLIKTEQMGKYFVWNKDNKNIQIPGGWGLLYVLRHTLRYGKRFFFWGGDVLFKIPIQSFWLFV